MRIFMKGKVKVSNHHDIYGSQTVISDNVCFFHTKEKIGLSVNGHELYLYPEEIKELQIQEDIINIIGYSQAITAKAL